LSAIFNFQSSKFVAVILIRFCVFVQNIAKMGQSSAADLWQNERFTMMSFRHLEFKNFGF